MSALLFFACGEISNDIVFTRVLGPSEATKECTKIADRRQGFKLRSRRADKNGVLVIHGILAVTGDRGSKLGEDDRVIILDPKQMSDAVDAVCKVAIGLFILTYKFQHVLKNFLALHLCGAWVEERFLQVAEGNVIEGVRGVKCRRVDLLCKALTTQARLLCWSKGLAMNCELLHEVVSFTDLKLCIDDRLIHIPV